MWKMACTEDTEMSEENEQQRQQQRQRLGRRQRIIPINQTYPHYKLQYSKYIKRVSTWVSKVIPMQFYAEAGSTTPIPPPKMILFSSYSSTTFIEMSYYISNLLHSHSPQQTKMQNTLFNIQVFRPLLLQPSMKSRISNFVQEKSIRWTYQIKHGTRLEPLDLSLNKCASSVQWH